jgi:hypothetical protein
MRYRSIFGFRKRFAIFNKQSIGHNSAEFRPFFDHAIEQHVAGYLERHDRIVILLRDHQQLFSSSPASNYVQPVAFRQCGIRRQ